MVKSRELTLEVLYEALKTPVIVRTVWRESSYQRVEAPAAALVVLVHPAKPEIDAIAAQWQEWSRRRQERFVKAIRGEGSPLNRAHVNAYVRWIRAKVAATPVGEVLVAFGAGDSGSSSRIRLSRDISSVDFVNSHAIKIPTDPALLYPMGLLMGHLGQIPELEGWWANKKKYGNVHSLPWLVSGMQKLADRMALEVRVM